MFLLIEKKKIIGELAVIKIPDRLFEIINNLKRVGSPEFIEGLTDELADQELKNIQIRFDTTTDPSGNLWAPLKKQPQDHKTLDLTGTMKNSFTKVQKGPAINIINTTSYAGFHQSGTKNMVARKFFPEGNDKTASPEENKKIAYKYIKNWILKK